MNKKLINLQLITSELEDGLKLGDFNDRLIVQKRIYLLQQMGLRCGYGFHWYLRGPYSPELTECAFTLMNDTELQETAKGYRFKPHAIEAINRYKELEKVILCETPKVGRAAWLELLASIHFLRTHAFVQGGVNKNNIQRILLKKDKNFSKSMINRAWELLDKHVIRP